MKYASLMMMVMEGTCLRSVNVAMLIDLPRNNVREDAEEPPYN